MLGETEPRGKPKGVFAFCEPGTTISIVWPTVDLDKVLVEQATTPRINKTLEEIQALLSTITGNELAPELIEQLGFDSLDWQIIDHKNALEGICVGTPKRPPEKQHGRISIRDALGIIWLSSRTRRVSPDVPASDLEIVHQFICASGVGIDNQGNIRTATAKYLLDKESADQGARFIDVSVSDHELPPLNPKVTSIHPDDRDDYNSARVDLATVLGNRPNSAGIISKAMRGQTEQHNQALALVRSDDAGYVTRLPSAFNPGFRVSSDRDRHVLEFDPSIAGRKFAEYRKMTNVPIAPPFEMPLLPALKLSNFRGS